MTPAGKQRLIRDEGPEVIARLVREGKKGKSKMTPAGKEQLKQDEGSRNFIYDDKTSQTVHYLPSGGYPSIGIGRNLSTRGITNDEIEILFDNDISAIEKTLLAHIPGWSSFSPIWQDVCVMIEFNTGDVCMFPRMLNAMMNNSAASASLELLNSRAARELPERYKRMADAIRNNTW